jgi:hypothetical protein
MFTPRFAGVLLLVGSVGAALISGWGLSMPPWGIPSALVLAGATVGMVVGFLWLFRHTWADKTWPPVTIRDRTPEQQRRVLLIVGIVQLSLVPCMLGVAVFAIAEGVFEISSVVTTGISLVLYGGMGYHFLRTALKKPS